MWLEVTKIDTYKGQKTNKINVSTCSKSFGSVSVILRLIVGVLMSLILDKDSQITIEQKYVWLQKLSATTN